VQPPRAPLRAGEFGPHLPPDDFEPISHARQQPVELLVTRMDLPGQELADACYKAQLCTAWFRGTSGLDTTADT
jgi:hypothetical protein